MKIPYKLSRDYKRLKELLDNGNRIACYVDYRWSDREVFRDICLAYKLEYTDESGYSFSARGITYLNWYDRHLISFNRSFEQACEKENIEFIDI